MAVLTRTHPTRTARVSRAFVPAAVAAAAFVALPFGRPDRPFWPLDANYYPWHLPGPWLWLVLVFALAAVAVALWPLAVPQRGDLLIIAGGTGTVVAATWLTLSGTPFGFGALVSIVALILVTGYGLSESGRIQSDAFVASSILLVAVFIVLFILFPLLNILRTAVIVNGRLSMEKVASTLASPLFILIENPFTPRSEGTLIVFATTAGTLLGVLAAVLRRAKGAAALLAVPLGLVGGFVVGLMLFARGALPTSLLVAGIVATASSALGLMLALLGQRGRSNVVRRSLGAIGLLPIITPPFILAFAMIFLFGRRGMVTYDLLGISSNFIFGIPGVALAQILAFSPIAYLVIRGSVASLDPSLEEASLTLGASRWRLFRTVTWPLLRPGLANAFLLTVIESFADFGNPLILGGDRGYLATEVFSAFSARYDPQEAAVYGTVLLLLVLVVFFAQQRWLGRNSFVTVTGKPSSGNLTPLPMALEVVLIAIFALWSIVVLSLYASILYGSFVKLWGINGTLTLQNYRDFLNAGWPVFLYTVRVAALSSIPAALLGFLVAYLVVRQRFLGRRLLEFGSMLSFAIPGTVMGVAYILAFNTGPWLLTSSTIILVLAFIFRNMPVAIRGGVAGLAQIDPSLEEASTTLRAPSSVTLRRVLVPLLIVPLVGGLIFAFVRSMTAISQVIFLVSPGKMLTTVLLLGWVEQGQLGRAAAMGSVLIVSMLIVVLSLTLLTRNREGAIAAVGP